MPLSDWIEFRHDLHRHPEIAYEEERTSQRIKEELSRRNIEHKGGWAGGTGVVGWIPATRDKAPTIALRADIDALPILENSGVPYTSTIPGRMHACGHDGHTAILLGVAETLLGQDDRPNNIQLIFQPAEEGGAGAKKMCDEGVLSGEAFGHRVEKIFGLHGWPAAPLGTAHSAPGPFMASADQFWITVEGEGGHAAAPHLGIDPIVVAAQIVTSLQTISSRVFDPTEAVVVTVAQFNAGTTTNVIPRTAELAGTVRTLTAASRDLAERRVREIANGIAASLGARVSITYERNYPVTHNNAAAYETWKSVATSVVGQERVFRNERPTMGAEDFSFYGDHAEACFWFLGLCPPDRDGYPKLHADDFDFNDSAIETGVRVMTALAKLA
ncbi:MAG: putative hydrolase YxeP [Fimbriimonadaceae bacterium]|nr:putative hydrolase YxeP [Fimbriimonadaceae bacterium]